MMSESQTSLPKRRGNSLTRPEQKVLRQIVLTSLLLDFSTLRTLQNHGKPIECQTFRLLVEDSLANLDHDGYSQAIPLELRVKRYVATLSVTDLDRIVKRPIDSRYYREMIYLRIAACQTANDIEEEEINDALYDENPGEARDLAYKELRDVVEISRSLYMHVKNAAVNGYLQHIVMQLREKVQNIDENIEDACHFLRIAHQPLVFPDDIDDRKMTNGSSSNLPNHSIAKERSALAFLVPVICALSAIPACFAWAHAEKKPGKVTDSDFFQLLASAPVQLLGIFTALWPIINKLHPDRAAWIQCWALAIISACLTISAVPLYLLASATWSGLSAIAGSFVLSFLQLQLVLGMPTYKSHED